MSSVSVDERSVEPLDLATARSLPSSVEIAVIDLRDGSVVEQVTLLRYAGHYRAGAVDAFAVRDSEGKFRVRSARQLGLTTDAEREARVASSPGTRDGVVA